MNKSTFYRLFLFHLIIGIALFGFQNSKAQSLNITYPSSSTTWTSGQSKTITWTDVGISSSESVRIRFYNGSSWSTLVSSTLNDGSQTVTVPTVSSTITNARIRIYLLSNSSIEDYSDYFTINAPSNTCSNNANINITFPTSSSTLIAGQTYTIQWNGSLQGSSCPVVIAYTVNGGSAQIIDSSDPDDGSRTWTVPSNINSTNVDLTVAYTTADNSGSAVGDVVNNFTITPPSCSDNAAINITSPSSSTTLTAGQTYTIQWNGSLKGSSCPVAIGYRVNNSSWQTIASSTSDDGSYNWSVPNNVNSTNVDLSMAYTTLDSDGDPVGDVVNNFTIESTCSNNANINITFPTSSSVLTAGQTYIIQWNGSLQGSSCPVALAYTVNGGSPQIIDSSDPDDGTSTWTVPSNLSSTNVDLTVAYTTPNNSGGAVGDVVNNFTVQQPAVPELEFTQCISSQSTVVTGNTLSSSMQIKNIGASTWSGNLKVVMTDVSNASNYQVIYNSNTSFTANQTKTISTGNDVINLTSGNYRITVLYTNAPNGIGNDDTDNVSPNNCSPTASGSTGTYHYFPVTVTAPASGELEFHQCISTQSTVTQGGTLNANMQITNVGGSTWSGNLTVILTDASDATNYQTLYSSATNFTVGEIKAIFTGNDVINVSPPGNYRIVVIYTNAPNGIGDNSTANVAAGSCTPTASSSSGTYHYFPVTVNASADPELEFSSCISGANSAEEGDDFVAAMSIKNIGSSTWTGNLKVTISEIGDAANNLSLYDQNISIGASNITALNTNTVALNLEPGNYEVVAIYNNAPDGSSSEYEFVLPGSCTPTGTGSGGVTYHYHQVTITAPPTACGSTITDINSSTEPELYNSADYLCGINAVTPQNWGSSNTNGVKPYDDIIREDLAKLIYFTLFYQQINSTVANYANNFPVPFCDLSQTWMDYYEYAKALCYLEYDDGIAPFDREFINFKPSNSIARVYALKAILEAFDIAPDYDSTDAETAFTDVTDDDEGYGYINKAYQMGLVSGSNGAFDAWDEMERGEAFLILYRLFNSCTGGNCPTHPVSVNTDDYFVPGINTPDNLNKNRGLADANFNHYTKVPFAISSIGLPLVFGFEYNSYLTELPQPYRPSEPLGVGWTHTYNLYVYKEEGYTDTYNDITIPDAYIVNWGSNMTLYKDVNGTLEVISEGTYDEMTLSGSTITITKKNQVEYKFQKLSGTPSNFPYQLVSIKDRNDNEITLSYSTAPNTGGKKRLYQVTGTVGRKLTFYYTNSDPLKLTRVKDNANREVDFGYNSSGQLTSFSDAMNKTTSYNYYTTASKSNLLHTITLPKQNVITNSYEQRKLTSTHLVNSSSNYYTDVNWQLNSNGNGATATITVNDNNNSTNDTYTLTQDELGYASNITTPASNISFSRNLAYDPTLITSVTADSETTTYEYFSNTNNLEKVTLPEGVVHQFTYTSFNDIDLYTDPENNVTNYDYNSNGNLIKITDPLGGITNYTVNPQGLVTAIETPSNITVSFSYDSYGNVTNTSLPLSISSSATYDNLSRLLTTTNPNGQTTTYAYNNNDFITSITDALDNTTDYDYDLNDNLTSITNAKGFATTYTYYDDTDWLKKVSFQGMEDEYTYYEDGRLKTHTDPKNQTDTHTYDSKNRLTSDGYADYEYYNSGSNKNNLHKIINDDISNNYTLTFNYDDLDRPTSYTDGWGNTVSYEYDDNSNITKITYPSNKEVDYTYDANNRMKTVTDWNNNQTEYFYHADGRMEKIELPNGAYTEYSYDAAGRLTGIHNKKSNGTTISSYTFGLDPNGNHISVNQTEPYGAPTLAALTENFSFNGANQLTGSEFGYDGAGNMTSNDGLTYTWDNEDQLKTISGDFTATYKYDGAGHRRYAERNGVKRRYVLDILGLSKTLIEQDDNGNPLYYYIHGMGMISRIKASNNSTRYYHHDFRGSTIAMTDNNENITHQYSYDPYGKVLNESEEDFNAFRYVGGYGIMYESEDIYFMRARYYDVKNRRFLSEDPVPSVNLYAYAAGNPNMLVDINGRIPFLAAAVIAIKVIDFAITAIDVYKDMKDGNYKGAIANTALYFTPIPYNKLLFRGAKTWLKKQSTRFLGKNGWLRKKGYSNGYDMRRKENIDAVYEVIDEAADVVIGTPINSGIVTVIGESSNSPVSITHQSSSYGVGHNNTNIEPIQLINYTPANPPYYTRPAIMTAVPITPIPPSADYGAGSVAPMPQY